MAYKFDNGTIDIIGDSDGYMYYIVDGMFEKRSELKYKEFRNTWDRAGLYFIARFMNHTNKRIYLQDLHEYK